MMTHCKKIAFLIGLLIPVLALSANMKETIYCPTELQCDADTQTCEGYDAKYWKLDRKIEASGFYKYGFTYFKEHEGVAQCVYDYRSANGMHKYESNPQVWLTAPTSQIRPTNLPIRPGGGLWYYDLSCPNNCPFTYNNDFSWTHWQKTNSQQHYSSDRRNTNNIANKDIYCPAELHCDADTQTCTLENNQPIPGYWKKLYGNIEEGSYRFFKATSQTVLEQTECAYEKKAGNEKRYMYLIAPASQVKPKNLQSGRADGRWNNKLECWPHDSAHPEKDCPLTLVKRWG